MSGYQKGGSAVRYKYSIFATEELYSKSNKAKWVKLFETEDKLEALNRLDLSRANGGFKVYKLSSKIIRNKK